MRKLSENEGEFNKRLIESFKLIDPTWEETDDFPPIGGMDLVSMVAEAKHDFPIPGRWTSAAEELAYWKSVRLEGQKVASWIKGRIETLEWFLRWFGENK